MIMDTYVECPNCGGMVKIKPDLYRIRCERCGFVFINPHHNLYLNPQSEKGEHGGLYYKPNPKGALYEENPKGMLWKYK